MAGHHCGWPFHPLRRPARAVRVLPGGNRIRLWGSRPGGPAMIRYEWAIEMMDGEDIRDVDHRDTFREAQATAAALRAHGETVCICLVRDRLDDYDEDL